MCSLIFKPFLHLPTRFACATADAMSLSRSLSLSLSLLILSSLFLSPPLRFPRPAHWFYLSTKQPIHSLISFPLPSCTQDIDWACVSLSQPSTTIRLVNLFNRNTTPIGTYISYLHVYVRPHECIYEHIRTCTNTYMSIYM